jgi:uncharacterized membrane protein HdeD (DUF308 family)
MTTTMEEVLDRFSVSSLVVSILLVVCGLLMVLLPAVTYLGVALVVGWLLLFSGFARLFSAFQSKGAGHIVWKLLSAICYGGAGLYFLAHPVLGIAGLALALAAFLFAKGVLDIINYVSLRKVSGSVWLLLDGIITVLLGALIWNRWPGSSLLVIGTVAGMSLVITGVARLMMTVAGRRLLRDRDTAPAQRLAA